MQRSSSKRFLKLIVFGLLLIAVIVGAIALVRHRKSELADMPPPQSAPIHAHVQTAALGELTVFEHYLGIIEPIRQAAVSPRVTGHLHAETKDVGDPVSSGEIIARMDDRELVLGKKTLEAELEGALSDLEEKREQFERRKPLLQKKHITEEALESAERAYLMARAKVVQLESRIESASLSVEYATLAAPFEGVVTRRHKDSGDLLMPGQPVYTIEQPAAGYKILVRIPQQDTAVISRGTAARISMKDESMDVVVDRLQPAMGPGSLVTVEFRQSASPFGLPSGATVGVDLAMGHFSGIRVQARALLEYEGHTYVFKANRENRVRKAEVRVMGRQKGTAVIEGPVSAGDRLVLGEESMLLQLGNGTRIKPVEGGS